MALNTNIVAKDFLMKVLHAHPQQVGKALALLDKGVNLDIELFMIKATVAGSTTGWKLALVTSTSTLMKNAQASTPEILTAVKQVRDFIEALYGEIFGVPAQPDIVPDGPPTKPKTAFMQPDAAQAAHEAAVEKKVGAKKKQPEPDLTNIPDIGPKPSTTPPPASPGVVKLADAEAVGQKVFGTSTGSVYRAIALNDRVKVAARVEGNHASIRVECKGATKAELAKVKSMVQWYDAKGYGSLHMDLNGVPVGRVLGAVIYGMGVNFDRALQPGDEVAAS